MWNSKTQSSSYLPYMTLFSIESCLLSESLVRLLLDAPPPCFFLRPKSTCVLDSEWQSVVFCIFFVILGMLHMHYSSGWQLLSKLFKIKYFHHQIWLVMIIFNLYFVLVTIKTHQLRSYYCAIVRLTPSSAVCPSYPEPTAPFLWSFLGTSRKLHGHLPSP